MNFPYHQLPSAWLWSATIVLALSLGCAAWGLPWRRFLQSNFSHLFLGSTVGVLLMWAINANGVPGLDYHYVGATLLTLMFGWRLAMLALALVLFANGLQGTIPWPSFPVVGVFLVVLPVALSRLIYWWVDSKLPNHFFVFIFLNAFFGAAVVLGAALLAAVALLALSGEPQLRGLASEYARFLPLMMFPEAFITGVLMTMMVVFKPHWVDSFDDERYLKNR